MNKNSSFIVVDSALAYSMYAALQQSRPSSPYFEPLLQGMEELANGEVTTLILAITGKVGSMLEAVDHRIVAGALEIHPRSRKVLYDGADVNLTPKEFDILFLLAKNRGEVFTKEQIYQAVWDEDYLMADSNIMAFIRKLRKKIEPNPDSPAYILTIWGIGYKFAD